MADRQVRETRQERSALRQRAMVEAAARVLIEEGPAAVTHRRVAAAAGVPAGSANYYFPSRAQLYAEAVHAAEDLRAASALAHASSLPRRRRSAVLTARLLIETFYAPGLQSDVVSTRLEPMLAAMRDADLREIMNASRPRLLEALRIVLSRSGYERLSKGPDVELLAQVVDASLLYAGSAGSADPFAFVSRSVGRVIELAAAASQ